MAHRLSRTLAVLLIALSAPGLDYAAEMGEARVASHIGQQLVADIELTSLEAPATPVQARLASPDVYRGASIAMPPALASLNMSVMRRDGRQFLHLTSLEPVKSDHLHVFLELTDGGQRSVRLATLWLTPDPNPAPLPTPVAAPVAATLAQAAAAAPHKDAAAIVQRPSRAPVTVASAPAVPIRAAPQVHAPASAASAPAVPIRAAAPAPAASVPAVPVHASPPRVHASTPAAGNPAVPVRAPAPPVQKPAPAQARLARAAPAPMSTPAALPLHAAAPAACPQPVSSAQASACVALDSKNAALREQISQLEGKVKLLQAEMGAAHGPVLPGPLATARARPAASAQRTQPPTQTAHSKAKQKRQRDDKPLPWRWIGAGAGLLAAAGGAAFAVRRIRAARARKAKKAKAAIVVTPSVMGGVRSRLMTDPPATARAVEPTLD